MELFWQQFGFGLLVFFGCCGYAVVRWARHRYPPFKDRTDGRREG